MKVGLVLVSPRGINYKVVKVETVCGKKEVTLKQGAEGMGRKLTRYESQLSEWIPSVLWNDLKRSGDRTTTAQ